MHWKIKRDPIYSELYEEFGEQYIKDAGFIYDNSPQDFPIETELECTPISFMTERLRKATKPAILLTTGAFFA